MLDSDALVHPLRVICDGAEMQFHECPRETDPGTVHTNFHPQMCVHLNASQFDSCRRMALRDWWVNVMEIDFGPVNANGLLKKRQFTL